MRRIVAEKIAGDARRRTTRRRIGSKARSVHGSGDRRLFCEAQRARRCYTKSAFGSRTFGNAQLRAMGHTIAPPAHQGDAHSIWIDPATGELTGAADRRIASKAAGY
jgi:hypothetical protein